MMEEKNEAYWGSIAGSYDRIVDDVIGEESRRKIYDVVSGLKNLGNTIEFGCGPGYFTSAIAPNASHVVATDLSDTMLDAAKKNLAGLKNVEFRKVNWENTGLPPDSFDTVFSANVIPILQSPEKALRESFRLLGHGGRLFIIFYSNFGMNAFERFVFMIRFLRRFKMPPYRHMMSPDEIGSLAAKGGFTVEDVSIVGDRIKAVFLRARKP